MDERHVYFAALIGAPWLTLGGAALAGYGALFCGDPGQALAGGAAFAASALAGELAWGQLWSIALPADPTIRLP